MSDTHIHPTAVVSPKAELGASVGVGPYAIIEGGVRIEDNCVVEAHAQVLSGTRVGAGTTVGRAAIVGGNPQSLTFDPRTPSFVEIGPKTVLREHVTIHRATVEGAATRLGEGNFLMVGSHVGHDAVVGSGNVIANAALLAGHVELGDNTYLGGASVFHQFLRIGDYCMVQGNGRFSKDIPHYTTVTGFNQLAGVNTIGLRRAGFRLAERQEIKNLYRILFVDHRNVTLGVDAATGNRSWGPKAQKLLEFASQSTKRGVCSHHRSPRVSADDPPQASDDRAKHAP